MSTITIWRPFNGIGDWLMALACVKYVNRQRPDVQVFVDWQNVKVGKLPPLIPQLFLCSDAKFIPGRGPVTDPLTTDSLVYRKWPPDSFIESMVCHLNEQTGLGIRYEPGVHPYFGARHDPRGNYIAMIGHGKKRGARIGKDWGFENFSMLAELLRARGFDVVQIGAPLDQQIPAATDRLLGCDAKEVVKTLAGARAFVGIENGITVLAGFIGVPQFTVYDGHGCPTRMDFEAQIKILERIEPYDVCERVSAALSLEVAC